MAPIIRWPFPRVAHIDLINAYHALTQDEYKIAGRRLIMISMVSHAEYINAIKPRRCLRVKLEYRQLHQLEHLKSLF